MAREVPLDASILSARAFNVKPQVHSRIGDIVLISIPVHV
jgi:hypothetical protein